jgi:DNA-directed RNA polymerase beta' subunit
MVKRIEQSARTVIGPDVTLEVDQVGIPITILKNLTVQEEVTQKNIQFL